MLLERGPSFQRLVLYAIGLICLCVVMYVLGSPMTLWTMQFALDQTDTVVLEGPRPVPRERSTKTAFCVPPT